MVTRTLIEISHALDSPTDETLRLSRGLDLLREALAGDRCSLLFAIEDDGERELVSVPPPEACQIPALRERLASLWLADERQGRRSERGVGWQVALPVIGLDQVVGVLTLERKASAVSDLQMRVFSAVAAQLGAYLTMLRLHRKAVELDRFKREMFAVVVHDLKNPMAAIMGTVDYLVEDLREAPENVRRGLSDVQSACHRILRLVANLLDLVRLESNQMPIRPVAVNIGRMLDDLVRHRSAQAKAKGIEIAIVEVPDNLRIEADPDLLARVIENILDNALRHTCAGDRIELRAGLAEKAVQIRVGNTGPPVPTTARASIFEKFGQASKGGRMNLGLGLYFARLAIEAHGGRIWVEETPALPAVFAIELSPYAVKRAPS
jgi:signal transduction histidine kinase